MRKKVIFITGASTGIGYHLTEAFLQKGWTVWAGLRRPEVLSSLTDRYSDQLHTVALDVTISSQISEATHLLTTYLQSHPEAELILINNAGIGTGGPLECVSLSEWRKVYDVNVFGLVEVSQKMLPLLRQHQGTLINVGSIAGRFATPYLSIYSSTKFAVKGLTDSLRRELQGQNIRIILVEPGPIETPIWNKSLAQEEQITQQIPAATKPIYAKMTAQILKALKKTADDAVPVSEVTNRIISALEGTRSDQNILIGRGIHIQALLIRLLPSRTMDFFVNLGLRFYSR